jgi:CheY-like chemotaxis protein
MEERSPQPAIAPASMPRASLEAFFRPQVRDARDGVEAVELAREHGPDVILLDLGLPRLGGVEAARRIRGERDVPIVALTGHREGGLLERAIEAGAASYVLKPYSDTDVVEAVLGALAAHGERSVESIRAQSRRALAVLLGLLGYPEEWAVELEERDFRAGRRWQIGP